MINEEILRYWTIFGFKLSRMEFIWGSKFPDAIAEFEKAKKELDFMLSGEFVPNEENYHSYTESILIFYQRQNIEIYSSILIGICIQRYWLGKSIDNNQTSKMLIELSRSSLEGIPEQVVPDKSIVYAAIKMAEQNSLPSAINKVYDALRSSCAVDRGDINNSYVNNSESKEYIFISYSSQDKDAAHMIVEILSKEGIHYWIAPESIPIGSDYTEEIVNAIENSKGVIFILSENSQKSIWVPKELDIALSSGKIIFPIHIDRSKLSPKMRFRLSNTQLVECYENFDTEIFPIIRKIKEQL